MTIRYAIHPTIGVARVGNSDEFYLAPDAIGGLPFECDAQGNEAGPNGPHVTQFKDAAGRIKRQGARFRIFRSDDARPDEPAVEVTLATPEIAGIEWTVHLANKKAIWYNFAELQGDLMLGQWVDGKNTNSYTDPAPPAQPVAVRNSDVTGADRRRLIIDPGPRTLGGASQRTDFSKATIPPNYPGSFPPPPQQGTAITTLGQMLTDRQGRLVVVGGYGLAMGQDSITSFAGADGWHDDVSDGPVTCRLTETNGTVHELDAWVSTGSPKFAPELVNIVTLDDIMFDIGVRFLGLRPEMYANGTWNRDYVVSYQPDVEPIIRRPIDCIWVANVPSMAAFASPPFDPLDLSEENRASRETYFGYFRRPAWTTGSQQDQLMSGPDNAGIPLMPLNSGSNSVWNVVIEKFLTLTETQYFMLGQWAAGKFTAGNEKAPLPEVHPLDRASVGNCVGSPMCPGIEVTWSTRNPSIYAAPYRIRQRYPEQHYFQTGLSTQDYDETNPFNAVPGCEPGDLTKRMAIPWQADFFQCTAQFVNFTQPDVNKDENHIPVPPTYYAYWWPPQSPMYVLSGAMTNEEQVLAGVPAGFQVYFARGINNFAQMIAGWSYLGFVLNVNTGERRSDYPYFVERERGHTAFQIASVAVDGVSDFVNPQDITFWPVWYLKQDRPVRQVAPGFLAGVPRAVRPVLSPQHGRIRDHHGR